MENVYKFNGVKRVATAIFAVFQLFNCVSAAWCVGSCPFGLLALKYCALIFLSLGYYLLLVRYPEDGMLKGTIEVDDFGLVSYGNDRMLWRDIGGLRHGFPFWRGYPLVSVIPKEPETDEELKRSKLFPLRLPGFAFVYEEIVPYLKERVPELEVPEDFPDASLVAGFRGKIGLAALICAALVQCAALAYSLDRMELGDFIDLQIPAVIVLVSGVLGWIVFGDRISESDGVSALRGVVLGVGASFPAAVFSSYLAIPPAWTFSALASFGIFSLCVGLSAAALQIDSTAGRKTILATLILAAVAFLAYSAKFAASASETLFRLDGETPFTIWSADSRYIADTMVPSGREGARFIFDLVKRRRVEIPRHPGEDDIIWVGNGIVLRKICVNAGEKKQFELLLYDIRSRREIRLDTADKVSTGRIHPVSPDGRMLAWISRREAENGKGEVCTLKTLDLRSVSEQDISVSPIELPEKRAWGRVDWIGARELFIVGGVSTAKQTKAEKNALASMTYDLTSGESVVRKTPQKADQWFPIPDYDAAFAVDKPRKNGKGKLRYIRLNSGEETPLSYGSPPSWVSTDGFAFRVVREPEGAWLRRFDLRNGVEEKLTKVSSELALKGVSPDGRSALFVNPGIIAFSKYRLYDIPSGKWRVLETGGFTGFHSFETPLNELTLLCPSYSVWAPSSEMAVLRYVRISVPPMIKTTVRLLHIKEGNSNSTPD